MQLEYSLFLQLLLYFLKGVQHLAQKQVWHRKQLCEYFLEYREWLQAKSLFIKIFFLTGVLGHVQFCLRTVSFSSLFIWFQLCQH